MRIKHWNIPTRRWGFVFNTIPNGYLLILVSMGRFGRIHVTR